MIKPLGGFSDHINLGNRNDELSARISIGLLLRNDFIGKVPCKEDAIVRLAGSKFLCSEDGYVQPGAEAPLLAFSFTPSSAAAKREARVFSPQGAPLGLARTWPSPTTPKGP